MIVLKMTRHNGTDFPGKLAIKLCPEFLKYVGKPEKIIAVTGTNGKTTVNNLITDILKLDGKRVVANSEGANIDTGIATSLIKSSGILGKCKGQVGTFEVDERASRKIYPYIIPDIILITNLSRDSIMRNGHPEYISSVLTEHIPKESKLIINGDDLISVKTAPQNIRVYFGLEDSPYDKEKNNSLINDCRICPMCGSMLEFNHIRYSHIGKFICPLCGFSSPVCHYNCTKIDLDNMMMVIKEENEEESRYPLLSGSIFNIYNMISVVVLLREMGYDSKQIRGFFDKVSIVGSRFDDETILNNHVIMMMAKDKNAFAVSRVFEFISDSPGNKEIIIMNSCMGDEKTWSENTCWLYDCDFELLAKENIKNIVVTGPRGKDNKLRLLMAGVPAEKIAYSPHIIDAPQQLQLFEKDNIYVLYGTDNISAGKQVGEKIKERIKRINGGVSA